MQILICRKQVRMLCIIQFAKKVEIDERTEIVKLLIDAGTDVNKKTNQGVTTLCFMRDAF